MVKYLCNDVMLIEEKEVIQKGYKCAEIALITDYNNCYLVGYNDNLIGLELNIYNLDDYIIIGQDGNKKGFINNSYEWEILEALHVGYYIYWFGSVGLQIHFDIIEYDGNWINNAYIKVKSISIIEKRY